LDELAREEAELMGAASAAAAHLTLAAPATALAGTSEQSSKASKETSKVWELTVLSLLPPYLNSAVIKALLRLTATSHCYSHC
jgi:hypothetical protein